MYKNINPSLIHLYIKELNYIKALLNMKRNRFLKAWDTVTKALFGKPSKQPAHEVTVDYSIAEYTLTSESYEKWVDEAYKNNETIHGALNLIINTALQAPLRVWDKGREEWVDDSDIGKLLHHINDNDTYQRFLKQLMLDMFLGDVGYIEKVYTRGGRLTELGLLRPDRVRIHTDKELFIEKYVYDIGGEQFVLEPTEVIPIQFIDPIRRFKGFSPLKSLAKRVDSDNFSTDHAVTMLQNRGQPGSILTVPDPMDMEEAQALARSWDNRFRGKRNGQTGVLFAGMTYTPFGMSMKDLDFSSLKEIDEAKILSTLRIPLQVYGGITGDAASTFNNVKEARKQFWEQSIIPLQETIEDALNNDPDLTNGGQFEIKFDLTDVKALQEDQNEAANRCVQLWQSGIITRNEARLKLGLEPIDGEDELNKPLQDLNDDDPTDPTGKSDKALTMEANSLNSDQYDSIMKGLLDLKEGRTKTIPLELLDPNGHLGTTLDEFLEEEGIKEEVDKAVNSEHSEVTPNINSEQKDPNRKPSEDCCGCGACDIGWVPPEEEEVKEYDTVEEMFEDVIGEDWKDQKAAQEEIMRQLKTAASREALAAVEALEKNQIIASELRQEDKDFELEIATKRFDLADSFINPVAKMTNKHLKRHINDSVKIVKRFANQKAIGHQDVQNEIDRISEEWVVALEADSLKNIGRLTGIAAQQASAQVQSSFDIEKEEIQAAIRANTMKFSNQVSKTSANQIKKLISDGFDNGTSLSTISKNIQALGKQWTKARADTIARTETARTANLGARMGYLESGVVTKLQYSAILDGATSDICNHLHGKIVGVHEPFLTQEEGFIHPNGVRADLSYDNGVPNPPAHPNCRSTIIPIIE